jgi:hypothetical protein
MTDAEACLPRFGDRYLGVTLDIQDSRAQRALLQVYKPSSKGGV